MVVSARSSAPPALAHARSPTALPASDALRYVFTTRLAMRWGDMDALGHLNNAVYLTYFEQARTDWLLALPDPHELWTPEQGPVVAHAAVTYKRPIVHPATVVVRLLCEAPRRSSVVFHYEVTTEAAPDVLCATGETTIVWVRYATGRPISLPARFHELWDAAPAA